MSETKNEVMSVEQIDKHIEKKYAGKPSAKMDAEQLKAFNLCAAYGVARPILLFARGMLFFKPKWQAAIDTFMAALDGACPGK